ncbi:MAG: Pr6Pr family membrane protein [Clostridia bacterium]|nr:Pr6Pr family membrane protein [Clostridia bacterium]
MQTVSQTKKRISLALKLIVILSAVIGTLMSAGAGRRSFMGGSRALMYFTIQSNILIALICAAGLVFLFQRKPADSAWYTVKLVGTVSITLTGVVFAVMLAPLLGASAWNFQNTLTHLIVPLAAVADFFVTAPGARIPRKRIVWVIVPPLLYVIYAGIGFVRNWDWGWGQNYPYFFLNWGSPAGAFGFSKELPFLGCVWWILILLLFLIAVAWCYLALADRIGRNKNKSV